jgi:hypothetical protein
MEEIYGRHPYVAKENFCHNICSDWSKYYIISISMEKNIAIFIPDGINSID